MVVDVDHCRFEENPEDFDSLTARIEEILKNKL